MPREAKNAKFVTARQVHEYYDLEEGRLEEEFHKRGFPKPKRPRDPLTEEPFEPVMPEDLTKLTFPQVGQLNNMYTQYTGWASTEASKAEVKLANREARAKAIYSLLRFKKEGSDTDRADQARIDKDFLEADAEAQRARYWRVMVDLVVSNANRDMRVISREITRRQAEYEAGARNEAMGSATGLRRAGERHRAPGKGRFRQGFE